MDIFYIYFHPRGNTYYINQFIFFYLDAHITLLCIIICIIFFILIIYIKHNLNTRSIIIFIQKIFNFTFLLICVYLIKKYNSNILEDNQSLSIILFLSALHTTYNIKPVFWKRDPLYKNNINIIESIKQKFLYICKNKKEFFLFIFVASFINFIARCFIVTQLELDIHSLNTIPVYMFIVYSLWMPVWYATYIIIQINNKKSDNINYSLNIVYDNLTIYKITLLLLFTFISLCAKGFLFIYLGFIPLLISPGISSKIINIFSRFDLIPVNTSLSVGMITGFTCDPDYTPPTLASLNGDPNGYMRVYKAQLSEFYNYSPRGHAEVYFNELGLIESKIYVHPNDEQPRRIFKILPSPFHNQFRWDLVEHRFHKLHDHLNYNPLIEILDKLKSNPRGTLEPWQRKFLTEFFYHHDTGNYAVYSDCGRLSIPVRTFDSRLTIQKLENFKTVCAEAFQRERIRARCNVGSLLN